MTETRLALILDQVAIGVPPQTAAVACGVPKRTWDNWKFAGRQEDAAEPYRSMMERLDAAEEFYHLSRVHVVHAGAEKDPRLAQWELERRFPEQWGDKSRGGDVNVTVTLEVERREFTERMLSAAARVLGSDPVLLERLVVELGGGDVVEGSAVVRGELVS